MNTYQFIKSQTGSNDLEGCEVRNKDYYCQSLLFLFLFLLPPFVSFNKQTKQQQQTNDLKYL